jgi:hypothetical protein
LSDIALTRRISGRIVGVMPLANWWVLALQKCCALSKDGLERVNIFLSDSIGATPNFWKFNSDKGTTVRPKIPSRNKVASRRLMIYLSGRRKGEVEFGWEMKVKIKVFFRCGALRLGG